VQKTEQIKPNRNSAENEDKSKFVKLDIEEASSDSDNEEDKEFTTEFDVDQSKANSEQESKITNFDRNLLKEE
jgi:uncharacterized protein YchJ